MIICQVGILGGCEQFLLFVIKKNKTHLYVFAYISGYLVNKFLKISSAVRQYNPSCLCWTWNCLAGP